MISVFVEELLYIGENIFYIRIDETGWYEQRVLPRSSQTSPVVHWFSLKYVGNLLFNNSVFGSKIADLFERVGVLGEIKKYMVIENL